MLENMPTWLIIGIAGFVGLLILIWIVRFILRKLVRSLRHKMLMKTYDHPEFVASIMDGHIMRGMSMDMVIDVWGEPADLDEVALKTKTKTEMKYDQKGKNRFGTRVYLEDGVVVGWETK